MNNKIVKIQRGVLVILVQTVFKIRKNKIVGLTTSTNKTIKQCKWCGRLFTLKNNHQLYCNTTCITYRYQEATRLRVQEYRRRWRNIPSEMKKPVIGTTCFGSHMHNDFKKEQEAIKKELNVIGLR